MDLYKRIIEITDANLIQCLVPIILSLVVIEHLFKKRFETKKVLHLICWLIILYSIVTWTYSLTAMLFNPEKFAFIERAKGPYSWAYWIMFLSALISPFTLLIKKIASNFYYVLFVAILIKIGFYFERFVIIVTTFHQDYGTGREHDEFANSFLFAILMLFIQGIIIALISLGIFEIIKNKKNEVKL